MYTEFNRHFRLAPKFFELETFENLKRDILSDKYKKFSEKQKNLIKVPQSNILTAFSLFGITFEEIRKDEYLWVTANFNFYDLSMVARFLSDYRECFYSFAKICVRNQDNPFEIFEFDFSNVSQGFVSEFIPIAGVNGKSSYALDNNKLITLKGVPMSIVDLYEEIANPWSNDSISYNITSNNGNYRCVYTVMVYDSIYIEVMGYGTTKFAALEEVDKNIELIKALAYKAGYVEDD